MHGDGPIATSGEGLAQVCGSVEVAGVHSHPWGMAEENRPINLCRQLESPIAEIWPALRHRN